MAFSTELIEYEDGGQTLEGYLARPEAASAGTVLVCHAWGGRGELNAKELGLWRNSVTPRSPSISTARAFSVRDLNRTNG